jgi:hypothetical protein
MYKEQLANWQLDLQQQLALTHLPVCSGSTWVAHHNSYCQQNMIAAFCFTSAVSSDLFCIHQPGELFIAPGRCNEQGPAGGGLQVPVLEGHCRKP